LHLRVGNPLVEFWDKAGRIGHLLAHGLTRLTYAANFTRQFCFYADPELFLPRIGANPSEDFLAMFL
jgi:hypothetical protein